MKTTWAWLGLRPTGYWNGPDGWIGPFYEIGPFVIFKGRPPAEGQIPDTPQYLIEWWGRRGLRLTIHLYFAPRYRPPTLEEIDRSAGELRDRQAASDEPPHPR